MEMLRPLLWPLLFYKVYFFLLAHWVVGDPRNKQKIDYHEFCSRCLSWSCLGADACVHVLLLLRHFCICAGRLVVQPYVQSYSDRLCVGRGDSSSGWGSTASVEHLCHRLWMGRLLCSADISQLASQAVPKAYHPSEHTSEHYVVGALPKRVKHIGASRVGLDLFTSENSFTCITKPNRK